jgi:hypothetical protein
MWKTLERPGYFGKKRDEIFRQYSEKYGADGWRTMWQWNGEIVPWLVACHIYEDGYYADSFKREDLWRELSHTAKDVYDYNPADVESGLDYTVQKGIATHLQDISIRRVVMRRGWKFEGDKLVQIRSHSEYWGENLSPGRVEFHLPELIIAPHIESWWDNNSIEDFYQSNKIIQVKE